MLDCQGTEWCLGYLDFDESPYSVIYSTSLGMRSIEEWVCTGRQPSEPEMAECWGLRPTGPQVAVVCGWLPPRYKIEKKLTDLSLINCNFVLRYANTH